MNDSYTAELRQTLAGHLDTLNRNLAVVSLETLKTTYQKPFSKLCQDIRLSADAYVKQIALTGIRIHQKYLEEALPLIEGAARESGILRKIGTAAFRHQDIAEIDALALVLRDHILEALKPFYARHLYLYLSTGCQTNPQTQPVYYNDVSGCILQNGTWTPLPNRRSLVFLKIQAKPESAA